MTIKYAQTLDGRIATASGHSRWVSGPESRELAHRLRAEHAAVLVGIGTVLADDPQLTVRLCSGPDPVRVVLDSRLRIPPDASVLSRTSGRAVVVTTENADVDRVAAVEEAGGSVVMVPAAERGVDIGRALQELWRLGLSTVLVEGGAGVVTSFLREQLADRLVAIVAPKILGAGLEAVGGLGALEMNEAIRLAGVTVSRSGQDIVVDGTPLWPSE